MLPSSMKYVKKVELIKLIKDNETNLNKTSNPKLQSYTITIKPLP